MPATRFGDVRLCKPVEFGGARSCGRVTTSGVPVPLVHYPDVLPQKLGCTSPQNKIASCPHTDSAFPRPYIAKIHHFVSIFATLAPSTCDATTCHQEDILSNNPLTSSFIANTPP